AGRRIEVIACETRPFLQGARLTAWELKRERIPVTLITDGMAAHLMQRGRIHCVVVGADRIAANGDVANKIGTYAHAVVAARHEIPFYVAAPLSTVDLACPSGADIPIEERAAREVTHVLDRQIAPSGIRVANPAFDVTPNELITAIITERGIARAPYDKALARLGGDRTGGRRAARTEARRRRAAAPCGSGWRWRRPSRSRGRRPPGTRLRSASTSSSTGRRASCTARCARSTRVATPTASRPPGSRWTSTR